MRSRTKPYCWAEKLGGQISVRTQHSRVSAAIRMDEKPADTLWRMGFRICGAFTQDVNVPGRATALVVSK